MDRGAAELRKRGIRIKLQEQPYRVLCLLLDSPGEAITREALCAALWPTDTFVEFERSLNAAVAKLRQTLGDSADNPRFIETVARRGYRFIAPIETIGPFEPTSRIGTQDAPPAPIGTKGPVAARLPSPRQYSKKPWILGGAIAAILAAAGIAAILGRQSGPNTTPTLTRHTFDPGLTTDPVASPDGKFLAYASDRSGNGRLHIWLQQLMTDGQALQLTRGDSDDHQPAFSPDGSKIAFRSERDGGGIYVIPTIGGQATLIANSGRDPRFSPDGQWIAYWQAVTMSSPFAANAGTVYLVPSAGGPPRALASDLVEAGVPVWSDDSKRLIVYGHSDDVTPTDAHWNWWVVPVKGGSSISTDAFASLEQKGFKMGLRAPRVANWIGNQLLFFGQAGDSVNVWKIDISASHFRVEGAPQRLTSGTNLDAYPSFTADRQQLLYADLTNSSDVWTLPMDTNAPHAPGRPLRVTEAVGPHRGASLSLDGRLLAYSSMRYGRSQTRIKDMGTGNDTPFVGKADGLVQLSADGSLLVYNTGDEDRKGLIVPVRGGAAEQFCTDCDSPYDISPDNNVVLYRKGKAIRAFNRASRRDSLFMQRDGYQLYQPKFSPDGYWLTFEAVHHGRSRLYIAVLRSSMTPPPESEWIPVTGDEGWADKPRWSPDGNFIYFISNRDGFFCLWAQRLAHNSKHPIGDPVAVAHFHGSRLSMANIGAGGAMQLSVARDKIALNLGELTGNIWATKLSR